MKNARMNRARVFACILLTALAAAGQSAQQIAGGSLLCRDQIAFMSFFQDERPKGISSVLLASRLARWQSIPALVVCLKPVVAGNAVAVMTSECKRVSAFAAASGKPLWQRDEWSEILESDGTYFYVEGENEARVDAIDPLSGAVVWSVYIPYTGHPLYSFHIHDGRLYTASVVIDLYERKIIHMWPEKPGVSATAFTEDNRILTGDGYGMVRTYDRAFSLLKTVHVGSGEIVELGEAGGDILAATQKRGRDAYRIELDAVTRDGTRKWQLAWRSHNRLDAVWFVVSGSDVLLLEPEISGNKFWLTSRKLSSGRLNWKVDAGDDPLELLGPLVLCGNQVYAANRNEIRSFDVHTGAETTAKK